MRCVKPLAGDYELQDKSMKNGYCIILDKTKHKKKNSLKHMGTAINYFVSRKT